MVTHRALDRDSVSVDDDHHLAAITSFARNLPHATLSQDVGSDFVREAAFLVPVLHSFLNGNREDDVLCQLREHVPKVRDALRQIVGDLDDAYMRGVPRENGINSMEWLLVGIHIEGMLFALFPERWEAMNLGAGEWGDSEILRNNVFWTHEGLGRADVLCGAWRRALTHRYGGA
jgi:hypothetical protein